MNIKALITDREFIEAYKQLIGIVIDGLTIQAQEQGSSIPDLHSKMAAEAMTLAAQLHNGSDDSFILMARRSLALVRTGAVEQ